jgi:phosphohistidine phosphatase
MRLYFMRHGVAEDRSASGLDADRQLTEAGLEEVDILATAYAALDLGIEVVLTSPLVRARQTAETVARAIGLGDKVIVSEGLAGGFSLDILQSILQEVPKARRVLLVGHEPTLGQVVSELIGGGTIHVRKAALAVVRTDRIARGEGMLEMLVPASVVVELFRGRADQ